MKKAQPELLVGLDSKLARVQKHWRLVDEVLPPVFPLVLLRGVERTGFGELMERIPTLRNGVRARQQELKLAWAAYERHKGVVHEWVRSIHRWMRAWFRGTDWVALAGRVPGRGQSYQYWWVAATDALSGWRKLDQDPQPENPGWPMDLGRGRTAEDFAAVVEGFEAAWAAVRRAEVELKVTRGKLELAQGEATALLMAYGHGVRARLGRMGLLVRTIPKVWPGRRGRR